MPCHQFGQFPCGRCGGCLASRASDWAVRLNHELTEHDSASFITLTYRYDPVHVSKRDAVLFMKRLRKALAPKRIRFFLASEYGDESKRPHYHSIIFGHDFSQDPGAYVVRQGLYSSPLLEQAWGLGHVSSGSVTPASIRYVTNYLLGQEQDLTYVDLETGETRDLEPTFALMSRGTKNGPKGLGSQWLEKHHVQTYKHDSVRVDGFTRRPPRYYDVRRFGGDIAATRALAARRREAALKVVCKDPEDWLRSIHPDRKAASGAIWRSKRKLQGGEL